MSTRFNPFLDKAPEEIPLPDSPLVRVIAQVQFSNQLGLVERPTISAIQKALGQDFPALDEQNLQTFLFDLTAGEGGGQIKPQSSPQLQWRFSHPDTGFVLQINSTSVTLETTRYTSRADFFEKFRGCLEAVHRESPLSSVIRLGVRYLDRVPDSRCGDIHALLSEEYRDLTGFAFDVPILADMRDFLVQITPEDGMLHARTGFIPKGATVDPSVLMPLDERSWVLDLDLFRQAPPMIPFQPGVIADAASAFALRIYTVFRWLVNPEFLRTFGGKI